MTRTYTTNTWQGATPSTPADTHTQGHTQQPAATLERVAGEYPWAIVAASIAAGFMIGRVTGDQHEQHQRGAHRQQSYPGTADFTHEVMAQRQLPQPQHQSTTHQPQIARAASQTASQVGDELQFLKEATMRTIRHQIRSMANELQEARRRQASEALHKS